MTDFKHGDKVVGLSGSEYTIEFGPYTGSLGEPTYLAIDSDGRGIPVLASSLKPVPADPRVEVVATALAATHYLNNGPERARQVLAALDAMRPAEATRYRDDEGGVWVTFPTTGRLSLLVRRNGDPYTGHVLVGIPMNQVEDSYGPLTPLTD